MNVEIGSEAAQFPEKEYINGIFLAVWRRAPSYACCERGASSTAKPAAGLMALQNRRKAMMQK
jgi:hypothetical protein